jgi:hypothetical protein
MSADEQELHDLRERVADLEAFVRGMRSIAQHVTPAPER